MRELILTDSDQLERLIESTFKKVFLDTPFMSAPTRQINPDKEDLISRKEAAKLLQISLPTLNELSKSGKLPFYRLSRRVYYKRSEIFSSMRMINGK